MGPRSLKPLVEGLSIVCWPVDRVVGRVQDRLDDEEVGRGQDPDATSSRIMPEVRLPKRLRRMSMASAADYPATRGEGHREADPPALADLVPDGPGQAGFGAGDQARGGGLQRHERRRLRAALLRRPRRAGEPRHPARGREAGRGVLRGRALLAAAGELLPRRDQVRRRRAGGAEHGAARCSPTAASPTPSRCGWRCSRSPGGTRTRSARASAPRSRWR